MFIKGFDENLKCRGYQFEIGKTYDTGAKDNELKLCSNTVFHFCRSLQQVHEFYRCNENSNRYCEIEVLGALVEDDVKCGSNKIRIVREITGDELNHLKGLERGNTGLFNIGSYNTGNYNIGDYNIGYRNTGLYNIGDYNSGDYNTGYYNIGMFNACNYSNGFFNTKEPTVNIFNIDSGMTLREFCNSIYYYAITSAQFRLTEWIEYTPEERQTDKEKELIGGYLKKYTFYEACENWWANIDEDDKEIIKSIPNFNADIFKKITGIEVNRDKK